MQEFYYWDPDSQTSILYMYYVADFVDMQFWFCYVPGACNA